jgi:hypothetical protein
MLSCLTLVTLTYVAPHLKGSVNSARKISQAKTTPHQEKASAKQSSQASQVKQTNTESPASSPSSKDIKTFNQKVVDNNYYVEVQSQDGNQSFEKATAENLKQLEQKNGDEVSIYQINQDGQWLTVVRQKR